MTAPGVERVVLRAAVGDENYPDLEQAITRLDALALRGVISEEGLGHVISTLANEIAIQRVLREFGIDLSTTRDWIDTLTPEDPT